jgi:ABC-2 type transport system permease protein
VSDARILDAGYRRYAGTRLGPGHAVRSVIASTLRRILGLRRPARTKVLPVLSILFAYLPAMVFVGVVALFNRIDSSEVEQIIPAYEDYYGFIISAIALFVTFVAPEALCPDRRYRVLSLYLASPLTRMTYLLGKAVAVAIVIAMVTIGPELLLLLGLSFQGFGPDGFLGFLGTLGRILASGAALAAFFTALTVGVASLTDRKAIAAAGTLLLVLGTQIVARTLRFGLDGPAEVSLVSLLSAPFQLVRAIHGRPDIGFDSPVPAIVAANVAWTALGATVAVVRYRRLQVTR